MKKLNINEVNVVGRLTKAFKFDHMCGGVKMYKSFIAILRDSGVEDVIPLVVTQPTFKKFSKGKFLENVNVAVTGRLSSYNEKTGERPKLLIFIKANTLELVNKDMKHVNEINLSGYICKGINYRVTPGIKDENGKVIKKGSRITDILLAVNTKVSSINKNDEESYENKRSYYIPCIAWNKEADYASYLEVGDKIYLKGRIQSRTYTKEVYTEGDSQQKNKDNRKTEVRTAYEVSIGRMCEIVEPQENVEVALNPVDDGFNI